MQQSQPDQAQVHQCGSRQQYSKKYHDQIKISLGYHDLKSPDGGSKPAKQYLNHFDVDKPYYSFNYKNVHFLALATETDFDKGGKQYKFVKNDLEEASGDKNIDWIVVFGYRPLYSSESEHEGNADLRSVYHPLFDKYGVDLVFQLNTMTERATNPK